MFKIVGKKIDVQKYLNNLGKMNWKPKFVVLHNTYKPSLSDRPLGFTENQMKNLQGYYSGMGWKGGPHFFVDQFNVWAFNPLENPGRHSPSWNYKAIGVEMLGNYEIEEFTIGVGAKVRENAIHLVAELNMHFGFSSDSMKLHKEDKKTDHDCPGKNVSKIAFVTDVEKLMQPVKIVIYKKGQGHDPAGVVIGALIDGTTYVSVTDIERIVGFNNGYTGKAPVKAILGNKYTCAWDAVNRKIYCVER